MRVKIPSSLVDPQLGELAEVKGTAMMHPRLLVVHGKLIVAGLSFSVTLE